MELNIYDALKNIDSTSYDWKCRVRLQSHWKSIKKGTNEFWGFNMIFIDDSNTRIQAFASAKFCGKVFADLKEGDIFILSNFMVKEYVGHEKFRPVGNKLHIFFTPHTELIKDDKGGLQIEDFAVDLFHMEEIEKLADDNRFLIDMVGKVVNLQELVTSNKNSDEKTRLKFGIFNGRSTVNVTFFDTFGEKVEQDLAKLDPDNRFIIISCAKVGRYEGLPYLSNYPATRVYINSDHYSLKELKEELENIVPLSAEEAVYVPEPPKQIMFVKDITSLPPDFEQKFVNCEVTVKKIEDKQGWYYRKCTGCNLEVNNEDGRYKCSGLKGCGRIIPYPDKRFRLCTICSDNTGSIAIIFPDDEISRITGKTVIDIHAECKDEKEEESFPQYLNIFLKKKYIITVQVGEENLKKGSAVYEAKEISQPLGTCDNFQTGEQVIVDMDDVSILNVTQTDQPTIQTPTTGSSCNSKKRFRNFVEPVAYDNEDIPAKKEMLNRKQDNI